MNPFNRTHIRENLKLAVPVMVSNFGHMLMAFSDNVMVGHLGAVSLAAAGLATVAFNVLMLFGIGVSYAITPIVAAAHGENNTLSIVQTLRHGFVINVVNSLLLIVAVWYGKNLLYAIDQPAEVVAAAIPFLNIITVSLVPVMIFQTFKQFVEGLSKTRIAMVIIMGANVLNIFLNYIFIYGHAGLAPMGLTGAGWATLISRVLMALTFASYVFFHHSFRVYRTAFAFRNYSRALFRKMLNIGIPSGVQFIFEVAAFDFSLVMMGWMGTNAQAAHQIAINLASISYMTTAGLATAATIRVGYYLGARDFTSLKGAANSLLGLALLMMCGWALLFIGAKTLLPVLYVDDPAVISIAASLLVVAGIFQLPDGMQVVCASALRGLQDVKVPSVFIFISYWVIGLPLGYWLGFSLQLGPVGIWYGLFIGLTLTATAMYLRFRYMASKLADRI